MPIAPGTYWDLLDRNTPPVKRRATHAKARTGCLTCKRRRVKCDEAKPTCARCAKSGHGCAGYEASSGTVRKGAAAADGMRDATTPGGRRSKHPDNGTPAPARALLRPKPRAIVVPGADGRRVDLVRTSLTPAYLDVGDALYFERFKCQMLADLGAWCGAEYWRHKVLREVLLDKTVQHAALAAAAMIMDIEQQHAYARAAQRPSSSQRPPSLSQVMAEESPSPMTVEGTAEAAGEQTITTTPMLEEEEEEEEEDEEEEAEEEPPLPVVPLSNTSAHGKAALRHYTTSIGLSRQTLAAEGMTTSTARPSLTAAFFYAVFELVQGNVGEADRLLRTGVSLLDHALSRRRPDGAPAVVADPELREIQLAFDRMRVTWGLCPYFGSGRPAPTTPAPAGGGARHFELPSPDAPLRTKQMFWNAFAADFGQFMVRVQARGLTTTDLSLSLSAGEEEEEEEEEESRPALRALLAQRTTYLMQLRSWLPMLSHLSAQDPGSAVLGTTRAYAQTAIVFLNCFLDRSELAYDAYAPVFADIVAAYQRLRGHHHHHHHHLRFSLDVDLFHIITFTVSKCRDRATRARALRVFGRMTRRQALWTNSAMLAALRALADLEDEGRDARGFVPPEARYSYVSSEWDFQKRRMVAVFVPVLSAPTPSGDVFAVRVPIDF
ncbi:hypothetical protein F4824DRAFT_507994 [Ustulina deusta]|nr:hypothetical protein F4824DRAFT_507994 [Ustulina deusta]